MGGTQQGYIYFASAVYGKHDFDPESYEEVKIGFATDPHQRIKTLETGRSDDLYLDAWVSAIKHDEKLLHAKFADYRIKREWFRLEGEVQEFIDDLHDAIILLHMINWPDEPEPTFQQCLDIIENGIDLPPS